MKVLHIDSSMISDSDLRIDAAFHLSDGPETLRKLEASPYSTSTLEGETSDIFSGSIFKRTYVSDAEHGYAYLTASDMVKTNPDSGKFISKKYTQKADQLRIHKDWILVSCSGTLGNIVYTNSVFEGRVGTHDLIRIIPNETNTLKGYLYAFLASKYGYALLTQASYGGVVKHIEPHHLMGLPVPLFPVDLQEQIHDLIIEAARLREEVTKELNEVQTFLMNEASLPSLSSDDYEFFGHRGGENKATTFTRSILEVDSVSINAFNYSKRIEKIINLVKKGSYLELKDVLDGDFFHTSSFKRLELDSASSIKLINQSDIFKVKKSGKMLAKKYVKADKLIQYAEVLIAGVGTLGENETFCKVIFANEELEGQLVSGEFIRMKANDKVPAGYLYAWLSSEYGFRLIRSTQSGTKLCRPIKGLLAKIPVPILDEKTTQEIDVKVRLAHSKQFEALELENAAISLVEKEIESWQ